MSRGVCVPALRTLQLWCYCARIAPGMLPQGLSTMVIHSVENLHACDLAKLAMMVMRDTKRGPVKKIL